MRVLVFLFSLALGFSPVAFAHEGALCTKEDPCDSEGFFTHKAAGPTKGDSIRVNPAAVPVEEITGIETIEYRGAFDFSLVKGLGRVGAAVSPSNSDETFFGPPAEEEPGNFYNREVGRNKFDSAKYTLAAAVNLFSAKGSGLGHQNLNLGIMGRYFVATHDVKPGAGLQAIIGPIYLSGALIQDEQQVAPYTGAPSSAYSTLNTLVGSYGVGLSLDSVMLDYSVLQVGGDAAATASVATLTGFVDRFILTLARREVNSTKPAFDFSQSVLIYQPTKIDWFAGVQFRLTHFLVVGGFYNYYLLREISLGATVFF